MICESCQKELSIGDFPFCPHDHVSSLGVHGDECDIMIRHGICNPDGSPKRYRSKSAIKQAAFEAGWTHANDTPKVNQRLVEKQEREGKR